MVPLLETAVVLVVVFLFAGYQRMIHSFRRFCTLFAHLRSVLLGVHCVVNTHFPDCPAKGCHWTEDGWDVNLFCLNYGHNE